MIHLGAKTNSFLGPWEVTLAWLISMSGYLDLWSSVVICGHLCHLCKKKNLTQMALIDTD
jgi:hypothetical protein